MKWSKKGIIFAPSGEFGWMNTHAQVPVALGSTIFFICILHNFILLILKKNNI